MSFPMYLAFTMLRGGKSMAETFSTLRQRSRKWTALSYVRFLRVRSSGLRLLTRKPTGNLKTMIEFGPKLRSTAVMLASKPVRMAATPMIVPVPTITPSTVRNARILCERMVSIASRSPLVKASFVMDYRSTIIAPRLSLHPQGFDGVEFGGAPRGIDAEEEPHHGGESHADDHARPRQRHRHRSETAHHHRHHPGDTHAGEPARSGQHARFHQVLIEDVAAPRAQRFADADLVGALRDHGQHDVHDHDAAHNHEDADDADRHGGDGRGELFPEVDDGIRGEQGEVIVLAGPQVAVGAEQHAHLVCGRGQLLLRARLGDNADAVAVAVRLEVALDRDHREIVERVSEDAAQGFGSAHHFVGLAFDLDELGRGVAALEEE